MLLSIVSNLVDYVKAIDFHYVSTVVVNVASVIVLILSALGRIKVFIKDCKDTTNAVVKKVEEKTKEQVDEVKSYLNDIRNEFKESFDELKNRDSELDSKLTKIMKKDPISKYKYGEVKQYAPQVTTYVAEQVVEDVKEEVELTPLKNDPLLPKKKRKAKTSFVD